MEFIWHGHSAQKLKKYFSYLLTRKGEKMDCPPRQHPVNGPELWTYVTLTASQHTDGLLLEQTGRCHFLSCSLDLINNSLLNNQQRSWILPDDTE